MLHDIVVLNALVSRLLRIRTVLGREHILELLLLVHVLLVGVGDHHFLLMSPTLPDDCPKLTLQCARITPKE